MFRLLVAIPTYNNARSIAQVVRDVLDHVPEVLVVNDGSTDGTEDAARAAGARIVRHDVNRGKGEALKTALRTALGEGFTHVLTIDGDGQHNAADIKNMIAAASAAPEAIILGTRDFSKMPEKNRFGNNFSNFWVNLAMGSRFTDTQCGLRVYPTRVIELYRFRGTGYEFETEVLIRHARAKRPISPVPVDVYYPPPEERVSHFVPSRDATRIVFLVMRFLFLPRFLWALVLFAGCAPSVTASAPLVVDRRAAALEASVQPFTAQQTILFEAGKDKRKADGLFIVYPGSAYKLRVLGPMMVTAFEVSVRCGKFMLDARDKSASGTLAEAGERVTFFPVAELFLALAPPSDGEWRGDEYVTAKVRAHLHPTLPAFDWIVAGDLTVQMQSFKAVGRWHMPQKLLVTVGTRAKLTIENDDMALDVPSESEALGDLPCGS